MERGLKIPVKERTKTTNQILVSLMNQLEKVCFLLFKGIFFIFIYLDHQVKISRLIGLYNMIWQQSKLKTQEILTRLNVPIVFVAMFLSNVFVHL